MTLIEINKNKFDLDIDLRYSTKNNITGRKIFRENKSALSYGWSGYTKLWSA